ncbi:ankyrin repeat domain-containing protein [Thermodesulfobacteriota bacterium]
MKVLVEFGADINARNINGDNALRAAARHGHTETVRFLIDKNSHKDDQNTALILAAGEGHIKTMEFLLHIGIDVNIRRRDGWKETPLISAAEFGKKKAVIYLLERGADIDAVDSKGMTALDHADVNKRASIVKILKKAVEVD